MSEFISRIVTPDARTIPQVLRAVGLQAERIYNANRLQINPRKRSCSSSSVVTVVHQLHGDDKTTEITGLREEIEKLREENGRLTAENTNLKHLLDTCSCTTRPESPVQTISHQETCHTEVSSAQEDTNAPSITGQAECCGSNSTDAIADFNRLPRDLSQFVAQMKVGTPQFPKFEDLPNEYKKGSKTKSAFSKRKAVYQYMLNYEGGLEKCLADFASATPTWLYSNKVKMSRM